MANKMDKYCYSQFVQHLKNKGVKYIEKLDVCIDNWYEQFVEVTPVDNNMKARYFSTNGGCQLF